MKKFPFILVLLLLLGARSCSGPLQYQTLPDGVVVRTPSAVLRLRLLSEGILRVSVVPEGEFPKDSSLAVVSGSQDSVPEFSLSSKGHTITLHTSSMEAKVDARSGKVSVYDGRGRKVLQEKQRSFQPIEIEGTKGYTVSQSFEDLFPEEALYGLGQHQSDEFNYKGRSEELFQYNTKVSVPFVVSTEGYGLLWDSYSLCRFGNPEDYAQLSEVFTLYDKEGLEGSLTGTYDDGRGRVLTRQEKDIYFEHLIRGDLEHVVNLPRDFNFSHSEVVYEGWIEPHQGGSYDFEMYYSGYQEITLDGKVVVPERWRTAWNPNAYKFSVSLKKGQRVPIRIHWRPNGSVAYCGLRVYAPRKDKGEMSWWSEMQSMEDYYVVLGDSIDSVIGGYRTLTGKAPIMPKWAMGFWQSREKYNTEDELLQALKGFRDRHIPIDNIVLDWLHWPQPSWGSHEFDHKRFPNPKAMVDKVHQMNAHFMISVWPKFYTTTEHYKEFDSRGWMYKTAVRDSIRDWVGPGYLGSFYDAYSEPARRLFWSQLQEHYLPLGVDAWWMDASEPNIRDCTDMQYRQDLCGPTALGPSTQYFNAYALMNAEAIYTGQRSVDPDRRVFLLTRSGFAGLQRYSTATWSGDIATRWEDFEAQITAGLNFCSSGIPYWTMDIGGFCVEDRYAAAQKLYDAIGVENEDLKEWRELNARWYQFGCFTPLFRAHGQWPLREPFNIAPQGHPVYESIVSCIKLRYRLLPYIYSLAARTYFDDYTIMRPMAMDFASDSSVWGFGDQYMFGPSLLVAPVYRYGARSRKVYLPEGSQWYDFYTGQTIGSRGEMTLDAPLQKMPLLVRSGSIIPIGPQREYACEPSCEPITLMVYAGEDAHFTLYDDDGVSYGYEKGEYTRIALDYCEAFHTLTIGEREGSALWMPNGFRVVLVDKEHPRSIDSEGIWVEYRGEKIAIKL